MRRTSSVPKTVSANIIDHNILRTQYFNILHTTLLIAIAGHLERPEDGVGLGGRGPEQLRLDDVGEEAGEDEDGDEPLEGHARVEPADAVADATEEARPRLLEHDGAVGLGAQARDPVAAGLL